MIDINFIMSGNATFTIENPKKKRYTFKVQYSKKIKQYFAYILTGPSNTSDYTYLGMMFDGHIVPTKKSKYSCLSLPIKVINYAIDLANGDKELLPGYFLEHNGCCGRCERKLTTPESIKSGLGPVCRGK